MSAFDDGLIAAWIPVLGDTGSKLLDCSPTRAHGSVGGMTWQDIGGIKNALYNNASVTPATVAANGRIKRSYPFSFAGWYYFSGLNSSRSLFVTSTRSSSNNGGFGAAALSTTALQLVYADNTANTTASGIVQFTTNTGVLAAGAWYHIAGVFHQHLVAEAWIDGVQQSLTQAGTGGAVVHNVNGIVVGGGTLVASTLNGYVADLRLWNRALTEPDVTQLYNGGPGFGVRATPRRSYRLAFSPVAKITGSLAPTLDIGTSTATGVQVFASSTATTLGSAASSASALQTFSSSTLPLLAGDSAGFSGSMLFVSSVFAAAAPSGGSADGTVTYAAAAFVHPGDDQAVLAGVVQFFASGDATTGADNATVYGSGGGISGGMAATLGGDTSSVAASLSFAAFLVSQALDDTSSAYSVPFQSPIEILWEDGPTILWETSDVVEWDELWVIPGVIASIAGPASAAATGEYEPPPSITGAAFATLASAAAGPTTSGLLTFVGAAFASSIAGATGSASGVSSASDFVGRVIGLAGDDYSTAFGLLKFVGAITGQSEATGQIYGPIIPVDGGISIITDGGDIFWDIDACTLEAVASAMEFTCDGSGYAFTAQACGACT